MTLTVIGNETRSHGDEPWVARLRGEPRTRDSALEELRRFLICGLKKSMASRLGGAYSAEDVVQDALVKIMDSLDQFAGRSRFTTWAMTVATRIAIAHMRRKHFQDVSIEALRTENARFEVAADDNAGISMALNRQAVLKQLQTLIDKSLSERQRFAIRATLEGIPTEVIAAKTGSNRNSVYKLVHDARLKLRSGFEAAGISAEELSTVFA